MSGNKGLLNSETVAFYLKRFQYMQNQKYSKKSDKLFINRMVAVSKQINNLHVRSKINDFYVDNDGSNKMGGSNKGPSPMECLLATLANCLEQTALLYFTFMGVKVNSVQVKVEASQDLRSLMNPKESPYPGFFDFKITWIIDPEDDLRKVNRVLRKVEDACPVKGTVSRPQIFSEEIVVPETYYPNNKKDAI